MTPEPDRRERTAETLDHVVLRLGDAETIAAQEHREVVILAERREQTVTWSRYAAGGRGPDLHVHREHLDAFYVLEGELTFLVGPAAEAIRVAAGGFVAVPPNVVHTFANESDADASWLNLHAPDTGFAAYLRDGRDGRETDFDSFDPPADGGLPAAGAVVTGPGEGDRVTSSDRAGVLKGVLPDLCVVEWADDLPASAGDAPPGVRCTFAHRGAGGTRVIEARAPDGGFADRLRRGAS